MIHPCPCTALLRHGVLLVAAAALLAFAGCQGDEKVEEPTSSNPPTGSGSGTVNDPLIVNLGDELTGAVVAEDETLYFEIRGLFAGVVQEIGMYAETEDPDMTFHGMVDYDEVTCVPLLIAGTSEDCWVIPDDGEEIAYVSVYADPLFVNGEAEFDLSASIGFNTSVAIGVGTYPLGGYAPSGTALSGRLQVATEWFFYELQNASGADVPFPGNVIADDCDVNDGGPAGPDETCSIPELTGSPPYEFQIHNIGSGVDTFTLSLTTP